MTKNQSIEMANAVIAGLTAKEAAPVAEEVTGGKHEANGCGASAGCVELP